MLKQTLGFLVLTLFVACAPVEPPKTQLQIREFQTRTYDIQDINMALKAVLNVLQDDGYIVKQADSNLGFLTAAKDVDLGNTGFSRFMLGSEATYDSNRLIECTANVTIFDNQTRVRVNFLDKILNNKGGVTRVRQVEDANFYQTFFSKVDKGMFLQKEKL